MKLTMSERATRDMSEILRGGRQSPLRATLLFAGPAVVASIAYVDPGNFATNIQAGSKYGYALIWTVLAANLIAMLFQALSAKLGIVTSKNLAELCATHYPKPVVIGMWIVSEIAAMATDLAEFLGGAIGLSLLFGLPLMVGMIITGIVTYAILSFEKKGFRPIELIIGALVGLIALSYIAELLIIHANWREVALGAVVPSIPDKEALTIAVGIVGATVMPHALYLHSGLTQHRMVAGDDAQRRRILSFSNREVVCALTLAGLVNIAMVIVAGSTFHDGHSDIASIDTAYHTLGPLLGRHAAGFFLVALIASGISSSVVGTMAGQLIMQGFVAFQIPVWLRRAVTMIPAFIVVALGVDTTNALVLSQVVLSFALPLPMLALIHFTGRADVMGSFVSKGVTRIAAMAGTCLVLALNLILIFQTFGLA